MWLSIKKSLPEKGSDFLFMVVKRYANSMLVYEGEHRLVHGIEVCLGYDFVRGVHGEHGDAHIECVYAEVGDVHGNGAASAYIDFAEFARLVDDAVIFERVAHVADHFGGGVVGGRLAARAVVLGYGRAAVDIRGISLFVNRGIFEVERRADVRRDAL